MKKLVSLLLAALLVAGVLAGCGEDSGKTISTNGSTSMKKLMEIYQEVYEEKTGVKINYAGNGSSAGITAVSEGTADIGLASRNLKDEEAETLTGTVVAIDGIALVVNPENPVQDLTVEQIAKLFSGQITNWKEVGGNDAEVVCIGREDGSGTRDGFESVTDTEGKCKYGQELSSTGDVITTVAGNPNAIGYASLSAVKDNVKAVSVEGVACSEESVQNGTYKVQRNFVMAIPTDDSKVSQEVKDFIAWCTSEEADEYVRTAGCVPIVH